MTPRQFFIAFDIPERWYFKSKKKDRWAMVIRFFEKYPYPVVQGKLQSIPEKVGASPWYYVEAVRRQLMLEEHEGYKRMPVAPVMKDILKGMSQ